MRRPSLPSRPSLPRLPGGVAARARARGRAAVERLRGAGYAVSDMGFALGRLPRAVGRGAREFWHSMNVYTRRRLGVAAAACTLVALVWLVAIPALPCSLPGGDECPPSDDAIGLVPGDALAYLHVNLDSDGDQYERAVAIAERVPTLTQQVAGRLLARVPGPGGRPAQLERDVAPWLGDEAALAVVPGPGGSAREVQLLEAGDSDAALRFGRRVAAGEVERSRYREAQISVDSRGLATALIGGFLVIGGEGAVREVIDAGAGAAGTRSLADSEVADRARGELPDERFADAYLSREGIGELAAGSLGAPLAQLAPLVNPGATLGAAAALTADAEGLGLELRSVLDPPRARSSPGFFGACEPGEPGLAEVLPAETLAYVGIGDPARALRGLLEQASAAEPGIAEAFAELAGEVRSVGGVDLERELLPSIGSEAAFALQPSPGGRRGVAEAEDVPGIEPPPAPEGVEPPPELPLGTVETPFLELVGTGVDEDRALAALARLQAPIASALDPAAGLRAPAFDEREIEGVPAQGLQVSPTLDLTYAVFDSTVVIATDPHGVAQVAAGAGGLDDADSFEDATAGFPGSPALLTYLDLRGLLALAEQAGLAADPAYATFAQELRRLRALGLAVESSSDGLATHARLVVEEAGDEPVTGERAPAAASD